MNLIDVHSHILHNIDDGSIDLASSIALLKSSYEQGVRKLILTPHFENHSQRSVEHFVAKRARRFKELQEEIQKHKDLLVPELYLGAEVLITADLVQLENIHELAIQGTDYILLEMPYTIWEKWMYECIYTIISERNLIPIVAHVERYFDIKNNRKKVSELAMLDVYFQINASSVVDKKSYKHVIKLINNNLIYFMGSDAHSTDLRPSYMREAANILEKKVSKQYIHFLTVNSHLMMQNKEIESAEDINVPKTNMSWWDKIFYSGSI